MGILWKQLYRVRLALIAVEGGSAAVPAISPAAGTGPHRFGLDPCYPNPFNAVTLIGYSVQEKGRVLLNTDPEDWIRDVLRKIPLREAPLNQEVAIQSRRIDIPHQDPADRFLAATAKVFELTLVTADERLIRSADYSVLGNP